MAATCSHTSLWAITILMVVTQTEAIECTTVPAPAMTLKSAGSLRLVSTYAGDFDAANTAIGSDDGVLVIDADCRADMDCTLGPRLLVQFAPGFRLTVATRKTVTFANPSQIHTSSEIQDCFDGPGKIAFLYPGRLNVTWWMRDPDDSADISAALAAAESAAAESSTIYFPPGTYKQISQQVFDKDIILQGYGATIRMNAGGWVFRGSVGQQVSVAADISRGEPNVHVQVGDESEFMAGDLVVIESYPDNDEISGDTPGKFREIHRVRGTAPGEVQLDEPTILRYDVNEPGDPIASGTTYYLDPKIGQYNPISCAVRGFVLDVNGPYGGLIFGNYCQGVVIEDVSHISTTEARMEGYVWHLEACQQVTVRDCTFRLDAERTKGPRFSGCQNVSVTDCELFENKARPLYFYYCIDVTCNGNQAYDNEGYIFAFESCYHVDCSHNHIRWVPDTIADYETSATSRPGIFICGVEKGTFTSNHIADCYGEGAFYIRTSVDGYPSLRSTNHNDDHMLPDRDLIISNNIISTNMASPFSVGAIYSKSRMDRVTISNNMIDANDFGIYARGDIDDLHIYGNTISTRYGHAIVVTTNPTGTVDCNNVVIEHNICRRETVAGDSSSRGMIAVEIQENGNCWIQDNRIFSLNQDHDAHLIAVSGNGLYGTSIVQILRNTAIATNVRAAQRGIYFSGFLGEPNNAGAILVADNYFDIPGRVYHAGMSMFVKEEVTSWPANDNDPNTWGISGKTWKTTNTTATTITDFGTPLNGQMITVLIGDNSTTFDFTDSGLKGRGADLPVFIGQMLQFVYNGMDWSLVAGPRIEFWSRTIFAPATVRTIQNPVTLLPVEDRWAPNGIRILRAGMRIDRPRSYELSLQEWTSAPDRPPSVVASLSTSSSTEAITLDSDIKDPDITPGSTIKADLPDTDVNELTVWLEYTVK